MAENLSFEKAAVKLLSPNAVHLNPGGRFYSRYQGNVKYLHYQYDTYGEEMLSAFAERHYAPGKLLERIWDGEYAGKWLDAATRTAVNIGDADLLKKIDMFAASLQKLQQPDGYLGIPLPTNRKLNQWEKDWDIWNQFYALVGFLTHYELRGSESSLHAAENIGNWAVRTYAPIIDGKNELVSGEMVDGFTRVVIIGQLLRLYKHTQNRAFLDLVSGVIRHFPPTKQMLTTDKPYLIHPYMLAAVLEALIDYSKITDDPEMFAKVEDIWEALAEKHLFPTGSLGESENLSEEAIRDVPGGQLQETCATVEWLMLTQKLFEASGKEKYAEAFELTVYNALLAAQSLDGLKWCYWTPLRYSKDWFHGPTRCCFWSGPRGIARIPELIYGSHENAIYVNLFESSREIFATPDGEVELIQKSKFPGTDKSEIYVRAPKGWKGILRIRKPSWSGNFNIRLNGAEVENPAFNKGYADIVLKNKSEYKINLSFDVSLFVKNLTKDEYVIMRGPEVLSVDIRDNIDTWLGQDDLVSIPDEIALGKIDSYKKHRWPGPSGQDDNRRRYYIKLNDMRTSELRGLVFTPYSDAGNEGAAFRTGFPKTSERDFEE